MATHFSHWHKGWQNSSAFFHLGIHSKFSSQVEEILDLVEQAFNPPDKHTHTHTLPTDTDKAMGSLACQTNIPIPDCSKKLLHARSLLLSRTSLLWGGWLFLQHSNWYKPVEEWPTPIQNSKRGWRFSRHQQSLNLFKKRWESLHSKFIALLKF